MSAQFPELVFLTGPQAGQRLPLNRPVAILGRSGSADIMLSEEHASRQQARYELLGAGPTLENLSERGTWINGRRYKSGKKVLLETGDLIGIGGDTQILFVAAGDDPDAALAALQEATGPRRNAFGQRQAAAVAGGVHAGVASGGAETAPLLEEPPELEELPAIAEQKRREAEKRPSEMTVGEREDSERRAKRKKILIGLVTYWIFLMLLIGLGVVTGVLTGGSGAGEIAPVEIVEKDQIAKDLKAPIQRTADPLRARRQLDVALGLYQQYGAHERHLHKVVAAFKEVLAYRDSSIFDRAEHDELYRMLEAKYIEHFTREYLDACLLEKSGKWRPAEKGFRELRDMIEPGNPLLANIQAHYERCKFYREKKEPKSRSFFDR